MFLIASMFLSTVLLEDISVSDSSCIFIAASRRLLSSPIAFLPERLCVSATSLTLVPLFCTSFANDTIWSNWSRAPLEESCVSSIRALMSFRRLAISPAWRLELLARWRICPATTAKPLPTLFPAWAACIAAFMPRMFVSSATLLITFATSTRASDCAEMSETSPSICMRRFFPSSDELLSCSTALELCSRATWIEYTPFTISSVALNELRTELVAVSMRPDSDVMPPMFLFTSSWVILWTRASSDASSCLCCASIIFACTSI